MLQFWPQLIEKAKIVNGQLKEEKATEVVEYVGQMCPEDNGKLIYRYSHKGHNKFIGCENFPKCKYIKSLKEPPVVLNEKCPKCGGDLVERENKRHQKFVGCLNYPKCKFVRNLAKEKTPELDDSKN
ncbi:topoisomerase DNA-binding C4 zinc finger domain-containing protein [bacterium]|nr:topoisomerase DNA-binding C4 zinc finger domain-containing protein [bacterium]